MTSPGCSRPAAGPLVATLRTTNPSAVQPKSRIRSPYRKTMMVVKTNQTVIKPLTTSATIRNADCGWVGLCASGINRRTIQRGAIAGATSQPTAASHDRRARLLPPLVESWRNSTTRSRQVVSLAGMVAIGRIVASDSTGSWPKGTIGRHYAVDEDYSRPHCCPGRIIASQLAPTPGTRPRRLRRHGAHRRRWHG